MMLAKLICNHRAIMLLPKRNYQRRYTKEYLLNTRESFTNTKMQNAKLKPILEANHTVDTVTSLFSMPL